MRRNQHLLDFIRETSRAKGATPAQLVLAWELAQRPFIVPIPGATRMARLEENLGAADISFTDADLSEFNSALAEIEVDETHF